MPSKKNYIAIIILILLSFYLIESFKISDSNQNFNNNEKAPSHEIYPSDILYVNKNPMSEMNKDIKTSLMDYSYLVLDDYFDANNNIQEFDIDMLFITVIHDGKVISCKGSEYLKDFELYSYLNKATINCLGDNRFDGVFTAVDASESEIIFTYLFNKTKLENNDLAYLKNNIELGIHAIELDNGDKKAYYKESVPIDMNYDLEKTLERLCQNADMDTDCYKDNNTEIFKYDTYSFKGDRQNNIIDLYRYNILIDENELNNKLIFKSISQSQDWYLNNTNPKTNLLEYQYYPSSDYHSSANNFVRQIAAIWALTELRLFLDSNLSDELIINSLDNYLKYKKSTGNYAYLLINDKSNLAYNAFIINALVNFPDYPDREILLTDFANGILAMQNDDGSYRTSFTSNDNIGIDYYPGEAMLSLMKLYKSTGDKRYLDSVNSAFPYYRDYWRENKNTAFIPWHTQSYKLLYEETENPELAGFIFEMNDWLIDKYQIRDSEYIDEIGGFPPKNPRCPTSSYMEGINDAYAIAIAVNDTYHIEKYNNSIRMGTRFILQTQYNENNTFYISNSPKAIGGFRYSLTSNDQRIDYTQHAISALIKTYNINIFKKNASLSVE